MHSYKSIVVVAGLGGVLLFLAGVLANVDGLKPSKEKPTAPHGYSAAKSFTKLDMGGSMGSKAPDKGLFKEDLKVIQAALEPGKSSFAQAGPSLKRALVHGRAVVQASDFSLISAELKRKDNNAAYESILLIMLGASKSKQGLPILEAQYRKHPMRVLEAIQLNGTPSTWPTYRRIYAASKSHQERYCILQALRKMSQTFAQTFLSERLEQELDMVSLKDSINLTRLFRTEKMANDLNDFILRDDERSNAHLDLACNALAACTQVGGARMLFEMYLDEGHSSTIRKAAGGAISFMKAPHMVQPLLGMLVGTANVSDDMVRFLYRNAHATDLVAIETMLETNSSIAWRAALRPTVARLKQ